MAKKIKPVNISPDDFDSNVIGEIFNELKSKNIAIDRLSENALSNVDEWIDTGSYALNAIISGSAYKGVPSGRTMGIIGPSDTGKTFIMAKILSNMMKSGYIPFYIDTEGALDKEYARRVGCDITKIQHITTASIEETNITISKILDKMILHNENHAKHVEACQETGETPKPRQKVALFLDSLGGLVSNKELADIENDKMTQDMGLRAKALGTMLRLVNIKCLKAKIPFIFTNHTYDSPSELYPTIIKKQSGGSKPWYIASSILQTSKTLEMSDSSDGVSAKMMRTTGCKIKVLVAKSRFVKGQMTVELYVNYDTGLDRYAGLVDIALAVDYMQMNGSRVQIGDQKLGYRSSFEYDPEFWEEHLPKLDKVIQERTRLSCELDEDFENETNEQENK